VRRNLDILLVVGIIFVGAQLFVLPFSFLFSTLWGLAILELVALGVSALITHLLVSDNSDFDEENYDDEDI
jgi:hypothetical protein